MRNSFLPLLLSGLGAAASSLVGYFTSDIAVLVFGDAVPRTERIVMLGMLACQLVFVAALAYCIRRRHFAELRAGNHANKYAAS
jgi:hypothetical protein